MRLIDADILKAELRESVKWHESRRLGYYSAITHINEQETAFDVDEVIKEIREKSYLHCSYGNENVTCETCDRTECETVICVSDVIEILRKRCRT